jgi:hypothetical protein
MLRAVKILSIQCVRSKTELDHERVPMTTVNDHVAHASLVTFYLLVLRETALPNRLCGMLGGVYRND